MHNITGDYNGNCLYNHPQRKMWVDVPKCASKSISKSLMNIQWLSGNYVEDNIYDYNSVVVVRDVLDRWKGSTLEICYHHIQYNYYDLSNFESWFYDKDWKNFVVLNDIHHYEISFFTKGLQNIDYVAMDDKFEERLKQKLGITSLSSVNRTKDNEYKVKVKQYVDDLLSDDAFVNKIYEYYKTDQDTFEKAKKQNIT